jgi:hypothetical protein
MRAGIDRVRGRDEGSEEGQFLTADTVQGNEQGQDPSASVGGTCGDADRGDET